MELALNRLELEVEVSCSCHHRRRWGRFCACSHFEFKQGFERMRTSIACKQHIGVSEQLPGTLSNKKIYPTHILKRFPKVWSSLCTTNVPAEVSLVSGVNSTLFTSNTHTKHTLVLLLSFTQSIQLKAFRMVDRTHLSQLIYVPA